MVPAKYLFPPFCYIELVILGPYVYRNADHITEMALGRQAAKFKKTLRLDPAECYSAGKIMDSFEVIPIGEQFDIDSNRMRELRNSKDAAHRSGYPSGDMFYSALVHYAKTGRFGVQPRIDPSTLHKMLKDDGLEMPSVSAMKSALEDMTMEHPNKVVMSRNINVTELTAFLIEDAKEGGNGMTSFFGFGRKKDEEEEPEQRAPEPEQQAPEPDQVISAAQTRERTSSLGFLSSFGSNIPGVDRLTGREDRELSEKQALNAFADSTPDQRNAALRLAYLERVARESAAIDDEDELDEARMEVTTLGVSPRALEFAHNQQREAHSIPLLFRETSQDKTRRATSPESDGGTQITQGEYDDIQRGQRVENLDAGLALANVTAVAPVARAGVVTTRAATTSAGRTAFVQGLKSPATRRAAAKEVALEVGEEGAIEGTRFGIDREQGFSPAGVIVEGAGEGGIQFAAGRRIRSGGSSTATEGGQVFEEANAGEVVAGGDPTFDAATAQEVTPDSGDAVFETAERNSGESAFNGG